MQTTIDAAGRIVVPKSMREAMGLGPGQLVDIALTDGRLEIEVPPMAASVETRGGLPIIRPVDAPGAALDDDTCAPRSRPPAGDRAGMRHEHARGGAPSVA